MNVARIERRLGFIGMRSMNEAKLGMRKRITLPRVIQREDYENRKKRLAPLPTAYDKTSTGHVGYHSVACHSTIYGTEAIFEFRFRS